MTLYWCKSNIMGCLTPTPPHNMYGFFIAVPIQMSQFTSQKRCIFLCPSCKLHLGSPKQAVFFCLSHMQELEKVCIGACTRSGLLILNQESRWLQARRTSEQGRWNKCLPPSDFFPPIQPADLVLITLGKPKFQSSKNQKRGASTTIAIILRRPGIVRYYYPSKLLA